MYILAGGARSVLNDSALLFAHFVLLTCLAEFIVYFCLFERIYVANFGRILAALMCVYPTAVDVSIDCCRRHRSKYKCLKGCCVLILRLGKCVVYFQCYYCWQEWAMIAHRMNLDVDILSLFINFHICFISSRKMDRKSVFSYEIIIDKIIVKWMYGSDYHMRSFSIRQVCIEFRL